MDHAQARKMMALYGGVVLGAVWLGVALLAQYNEQFILFGAFEDLGFLFWVVFTVLGLALVGTLSWAFLTWRDDEAEAPKTQPSSSATDPVKFGAGWNPLTAPTEERTKCARCSRLLPIWRMAEGTCTVCAPFSVFLDPPRKQDVELDRRRNRLFILQGLGFALMALAFVSAVYMFPILLTPEGPVLATVGFLVFSPLLFGLILLAYAHSQAVPQPDK